MRRAVIALAGALGLSACSEPELLSELASDRPGAAQAELLRRGPEALPMLRDAMRSRDRVLARRALDLVAKISGQWGSDGGILWRRSLGEAVESNPEGRPILLLQLFGRLDEELC
jgi:hypothetical protein